MKSKTLGIAIASLLAAGSVPAVAQGLAQDRTYYPPDGSTYSQDNERWNSDNRYRDRNWDDRYRGDRGRGDVARVIESHPVYVAETREECWNPRAGHYEEVRGQEKTRIGKGAAIGAVTGGVLGHQVDHGTGTAAGAVIGGLLGHQLERRNNRDDQDDLDRSRCRVIGQTAGNDVQGYDVRYEYRGREYTARMAHDPGRSLRVGEDINPDGTPLAIANADNRPYSWR
jgi:uncharacterized protein YcfJ